MRRGKFITFEGGEGSGKTYQAEMLLEHLKKEKYDVYKTREPGGTLSAETIRKVILDPAYKLNKSTELLLFCAARSEFVSTIKPLLKKGTFVICDRFEDSTKAYQGYGRGLPLDIIDSINSFATGGLKPDITFLLNISPKLGLAKATATEFGKKDRIESAGEQFHKKVNAGFLKLAKQEPNRIKVIDYIPNGQLLMQEKIVSHVNELLLKYK